MRRERRLRRDISSTTMFCLSLSVNLFHLLPNHVNMSDLKIQYNRSDLVLDSDVPLFQYTLATYLSFIHQSSNLSSNDQELFHGFSYAPEPDRGLLLRRRTSSGGKYLPRRGSRSGSNPANVSSTNSSTTSSPTATGTVNNNNNNNINNNNNNNSNRDSLSLMEQLHITYDSVNTK